MRRLLLLILAIATACTSSEVTTTTETPPPSRLVTLSAQGELATMDPDGDDVIDMLIGPDRLVLQPTWSPGGSRLAWVEVVLTGGPDDVAVVVAAPGSSEEVRVPVESPPFYMEWAGAGDKLILLRNGVVELEAGVIDFGTAQPEEFVFASGQPFYFAWSPGGDSVLANVGVSDRLELIGLDGSVESLGQSPGLFQAPGWSEDRAVWVLADGDGQALVTSDADGGDQEVVATTDDFIHMLVSPNGTKVAYRELDLSAPAVTASLMAQDTPPGELVVVDLDSGETVAIDDDNALAFFWSPDSEKLLFLNVASGGFTWRVWDGSDVTTYETFAPSRTFGRDYLPFFDQFAHSIELWSPDSASFTYAGRADTADSSQVWIQPLEGPVVAVTEGVFAAFAPAT